VGEGLICHVPFFSSPFSRPLFLLSPVHINDIVLGRRDVTVDTDARLAAALGTEQCFWLELQAEFDLEKACRVCGSSVTQSQEC